GGSPLLTRLKNTEVYLSATRLTETMGCLGLGRASLASLAHWVHSKRDSFDLGACLATRTRPMSFHTLRGMTPMRPGKFRREPPYCNRARLTLAESRCLHSRGANPISFARLRASPGAL